MYTERPEVLPLSLKDVLHLLGYQLLKPKENTIGMAKNSTP